MSLRRLLFLSLALPVLAACGTTPQRAVTRAPLPPAARALATRDEGTLPIGTVAPDLTMTNFDNQTEQLAAYRGKAVLLVFWATWCPTCTNELPTIDALHDALAPRGFTVLAVNASNEKIPGLKQFAEWKGLTMPIFGQYTGAAKRDFAITAIPTLYFLDRKGVIRDTHVGGLTLDELKQRCEVILK